MQISTNHHTVVSPYQKIEGKVSPVNSPQTAHNDDL
jgi:hypothetical protein